MEFEIEIPEDCYSDSDKLCVLISCSFIMINRII